MIKHILCPFHEESTPSLALYHDGYRCFGCGAYGSLADLKGHVANVPEVLPAEPEDVEGSIQRIERLPKGEIRGLELHFDDRAYYLVWPTRDYYKARYFNPEKGKYRNPRGHKQPILEVQVSGRPTLAVVEGEFNALSVAKAVPEIDVISPGSAGNFAPANMRKYCTSLVLYSTILVIADRDAPGATACIDLMGMLTGRVRKIKAHLMSPDANEVLVERGCEELRREISKVLGEDLEAGSAKG
jgi:hypothetical protein